jgi:hypothetical protein
MPIMAALKIVVNFGKCFIYIFPAFILFSETYKGFRQCDQLFYE